MKALSGPQETGHKKIKERPQIHDVVLLRGRKKEQELLPASSYLYWSSREHEAMFRLHTLHRHRKFRLWILDYVSLGDNASDARGHASQERVRTSSRTQYSKGIWERAAISLRNTSYDIITTSTLANVSRNLKCNQTGSKTAGPGTNRFRLAGAPTYCSGVRFSTNFPISACQWATTVVGHTCKR